MNITSQDIPGILERHKKWLKGEQGGQRADLSGADLSDANLSDAKVAGGSKVATFGPVGDNDRAVIGVMTQADDAHKKPWLLLICGCFSGDETQYKERVGAR